MRVGRLVTRMGFENLPSRLPGSEKNSEQNEGASTSSSLLWARAVGLLGVGLSGCLAVGLLGCWAVGLSGVRCRAVGLLGCWAVRAVWLSGCGCWALGVGLSGCIHQVWAPKICLRDLGRTCGAGLVDSCCTFFLRGTKLRDGAKPLEKGAQVQGSQERSGTSRASLTRAGARRAVWEGRAKRTPGAGDAQRLW